jgi:uncharacterized protein YlxP (DUF503 family)
LEIDIEFAISLKDKRSVLNRIKERVRKKFNVSIAEVEGNELHNYACLGVAFVTNERKFANQVLNKVVDEVEAIKDCVLADYAMEFLRS